MGLLDLVEQDHRIGVPLHLLGELPALFVPDVPRRRANQLAHRVLLHVLGHVEADERVVAAEQQVRERPRELGLADAGRAEEQEAADRTRRRLQARARTADGARHRGDRLVLADHARVQLLFHPEQLVALVLVDRGERHAGPLGDDLVDLRPADRSRGDGSTRRRTSRARTGGSRAPSLPARGRTARARSPSARPRSPSAPPRRGCCG